MTSDTAVDKLLTTATDILAAKRLTRLIVEDKITEPIRDHHFVTSHENLSYLLNCPYCVSVYTGAAAALSSILFPRTSKPLRYGLAIAEVIAILTDIKEQRQALVDDYGPPL